VSDLGIDVKALNTTVQQAIAPMFWGVITLAALIPIAAAGGGWVAEKITGWDNKKKKEK
jgi:hypothetical protein